MSIAAGILLQAVASTGAVGAEPADDTPTTDTAGVETPAGADLPSDDLESEPVAPAETTIDEALPTVAVGAEEAVPDAAPQGVPAEEEEDESAFEQQRNRVTARGGGAQPGGDWEFSFHGYFRAPMRFGLNERQYGDNAGDLSLHYPIVPDDQYFSWQYSMHQPRDWAELYFSYGNGIATGTVSIQGFNFTDAAWKENRAQFGVAQAFVTLTPEFRMDWFDLKWKIGSFDNRYGEAGQYDAGAFETYLFGRTHGTGEAGRLEFYLGEDKEHVIGVEHGLAVNRPNPSFLNAHRFTLLHHWHLDYEYRRRVYVGFHYLNATANEADRLAERVRRGAPNGNIHVLGPDFRLDWGRIGYLYAGLSYILLQDAAVVGPAIEVLHSAGGGTTPLPGQGVDGFSFNNYLGTVPGPFAGGLVDNYLQGPLRQNQAGNGSIMTVLAEYDNSVKNIMQGDKFDGESWDVGFKLYAMFNRITSDDPDVDGINKVKFGGDVFYQPLKWIGLGFRATHLRPHSAVPEQAFTVLSPRIFFQTNWISRERIELSYTRYVYAQRTCPGLSVINPDTGQPDDLTLDNYDPVTGYSCVQPPPLPAGPESFGATPSLFNGQERGQVLVPPDENVLMLKATFWW